MTDAATVFFQGLLFFILLHIIGHPITTFILRRRGIPAKLTNLDFIERLPLEFVVGGILIYITALITTPFKGFTAFACWAITGTTALFYLYMHRTGIVSFARRPSLHVLAGFSKRPSLFSWIAVLCFLLALAVRVVPISSFVLGSNQDISLHTLYTYSITRNAGIPDYAIAGFPLQTPIATHTILAYFSLLTGIPPEFVTFNSLVFFGAIIILAAYFFGSIIGSQEFGLLASILMVNISIYPIGITWGSPWLVLGLIIFFVASAVSISVFLENFKCRKSLIYTTFFPGVLTGFLASTYIPLYFILLVMFLLLIAFWRQAIRSKIVRLAIMIASGIPLFAIWIYRYFFVTQSYSPFFIEKSAAAIYDQALQASTTFLPLRNLYSPTVIINTISNWLTWSDKLGWPGAYVYVPLLSAGFFFLVYRLVRYRTHFFESLVPKYIVAIIGIIFLWGLNGPLGLFYIRGLGLDIMIGELDKIAPIIGTILLPFVIAYVLTSFGHFLSKYSKKITYTSYHIAIFLLSVSIAIVPLSQIWLVGNYNVFATSTESDYALLKWMNAEIPHDSDVLVNAFDAGQYVASIGGQKAFGIASTGVVFLSDQYEVLHYHIENQILNSTTVAIFRNINVDYVFVGGQSFRARWDPQYFLRNPLYFRTVQNINGSYLFAVKIPERSMTSGFVNSSDYLGFSNNETLIDMRHMAIYNLETGEGVHFEIALKDKSNNVLDIINSWNEPKEIQLSGINNPNTGINLRLVGSTYSFDLALLSISMNEISLGLSVEHAPEASMVYISYFPVHEVRQSNVRFFTDTVNDWSLPGTSIVQTILEGGATFFQIDPKGQTVLGYKDHLVMRSNTFVNFTTKTRPLEE